MIFFRSTIYSPSNNGKGIRSVFLIILILIITQLLGCSSSSKEYIVVGAASSLTNVMEELGPKFTEETGIDIKLSYASSGTLKNQIEDGAPIDVFISASENKMNGLKSNSKIDKVSNLLKNRIVFVVNNSYSLDIKEPKDLLGTENLLAIGEPETVPAGNYAKEVLLSLDLWDKINGQNIYGKNVRQVADYLNAGEVSSAFIYKTDLSILKNEYTYYLISEDLHKPIIYPMGIVTESLKRDEAIVFQEFLQSDMAKNIFLKYGFELGD